MIYSLMAQRGVRGKNDKLTFPDGGWISIHDITSEPFGVKAQRFFSKISTPELQAYMGQMTMQQIQQYLVSEINRYYQNPPIVEPPEEELSEDQKRLLETHKLVLEVEAGKEVLWSVEDRRPSKISPTIFWKKLPSALYTKLRHEAALTRLAFDPFKGTQTHWAETLEGQQIQVLNSYRPPIWYTQDLNPNQYINQPEFYPDLFKYLVANLVPHAQDQNVLLDWLALAVFDRPHALLNLRGIRGNGKTIFKHVVYHLVGNFLEAQQRIFGDFNAEMREKRIVGVDDNEELGTRKGHTLRKRLTNPTITFNRKHAQTEFSEKQFASIIVCSNTENQFYVEHDERKIVSLLLTDKKMEAWPQISEPIFDWLKPFEAPDHEALTPAHVEFLRQIGVGLFTRLVNRRPNIAMEYFGGWFWADVVFSLPSFKRYVVDLVRGSTGMEAIEYDYIKAEYSADVGRGEIPQWPTLVRWMTGGFNLWGNRIYTEIDNKAKTFIPNPQLRMQH